MSLKLLQAFEINLANSHADNGWMGVIAGKIGGSMFLTKFKLNASGCAKIKIGGVCSVVGAFGGG